MTPSPSPTLGASLEATRDLALATLANAPEPVRGCCDHGVLRSLVPCKYFWLLAREAGAGLWHLRQHLAHALSEAKVSAALSRYSSNEAKVSAALSRYSSNEAQS